MICISFCTAGGAYESPGRIFLYLASESIDENILAMAVRGALGLSWVALGTYGELRRIYSRHSCDGGTWAAHEMHQYVVDMSNSIEWLRRHSTDPLWRLSSLSLSLFALSFVGPMLVPLAAKKNERGCRAGARAPAGPGQTLKIPVGTGA